MHTLRFLNIYSNNLNTLLNLKYLVIYLSPHICISYTIFRKMKFLHAVVVAFFLFLQLSALVSSFFFLFVPSPSNFSFFLLIVHCFFPSSLYYLASVLLIPLICNFLIYISYIHILLFTLPFRFPRS